VNEFRAGFTFGFSLAALDGRKSKMGDEMDFEV
jgi:hypothetical protein